MSFSLPRRLLAFMRLPRTMNNTTYGDEVVTYIAPHSSINNPQPYHLRRCDYLNPLTWDYETHYLNVMVNGVEVEFDFWSGGSIVHLINQPSIGDKVELKVEEIVFLD